MSVDDYAVVGRVRRAHGIHGELLVEPFTDTPDAIFASGRRVYAGTSEGEPANRKGRAAATPEELEIRSVRPFRGGVLVTFDAVPDRTEAERWNDRTLLLPLTELHAPEGGAVFLHELIGLRVLLEDGAPLGSVRAFYELPQGIVLEVVLAGPEPQRDFLLPFTDDVVLTLDGDSRTITVRIPEGLLE
jgi:16S rRNA processing protein RimM